MPVEGEAERSRPWLFVGACLGALVIVWGAYANSFQNAFHFDDSHVIETNLYIQSLSNLPLFFTDARTFSSLPTNATYRPLVSLSLALDYWLAGGLVLWYFHASQFVMLLLLSLMLFRVFLRVMNQAQAHWGNRYLALFCTLWFAVHTVNTETINYISARSELLAALGMVGGFLVYFGLPRWRWTSLYILPMFIGALAKPSAVIFAPLFFVYVLLYEQQFALPDLLSARGWRLVWAALRVSLPALLLGIAIFAFVESMNAPTASYGGGGRWEYLLTQCFMWLHYARLFVLPLGLTADTDMTLIPAWYDTRVVAGVAFLVALLRVLWQASRTPASRPVAFGLAWFAFTLLPTSSLFPLAEVNNEHRVFMPYMGLMLAVVWGLALQFHHWCTKWAHRRALLLRGACAGAVLIVCSHAVGTYYRNMAWRTEETLWSDVVQKSPTNGRAWMNYGLSVMGRGDYPEAKRLFEQAQRYTPSYAALQTNLGIVNAQLDMQLVAEQHFQRALQLDPDFVGGHYFYARWLVEQSRAREALPLLQRALRLSPGFYASRVLLMQLYGAQAAEAELATLIQETLALLPTDPLARAYARGEMVTVQTPSAQAYYERGVELTNAGQHLEAALAYRQALRFDPSSADAANNLGWSLAKLGFYEEAIAPLEQALRLNPDFALARNNLAWVRSEVGKKD
ncbi:MAG: tetratricopeptide repeat protein [Deltaproteobacteria bacterium]|nr:tetratricopeptide repeat protein [Deltaproteobacteria bacterium]